MKTAIITGAATGLGFEFAKLLAKDGYNLVLVDIRKIEIQQAKDTLLKISKVGIDILVLDLSTYESADRLYLLTKKYNPDVVINNAGFGLGGYFAHTDWEIEQKMINLHVYTPTHYCKLVLKDMIELGTGKIMNVSSIAAYTPGPLMAIYYATKGFLLSFGRAISYELKGTGVSLTTVCPGITKTLFAPKRASLSGVKPPNYGPMADSAEKVATIAYKAMIKGKVVSIPIFKNRVMHFMMWLLPDALVIRFVRKSQAQLNSL